MHDTKINHKLLDIAYSLVIKNVVLFLWCCKNCDRFKKKWLLLFLHITVTRGQPSWYPVLYTNDNVSVEYKWNGEITYICNHLKHNSHYRVNIWYCINSHNQTYIALNHVDCPKNMRDGNPSLNVKHVSSLFNTYVSIRVYSTYQNTMLFGHNVSARSTCLVLTGKLHHLCKHCHGIAWATFSIIFIWSFHTIAESTYNKNKLTVEFLCLVGILMKAL